SAHHCRVDNCRTKVLLNATPNPALQGRAVTCRISKNIRGDITHQGRSSRLRIFGVAKTAPLKRLDTRCCFTHIYRSAAGYISHGLQSATNRKISKTRSLAAVSNEHPISRTKPLLHGTDLRVSVQSTDDVFAWRRRQWDLA